MKGKRAGMMHPKNKVYSGIFFLLLGKLTIAMIVFKFNSEIGRLLVIYYVGNEDKNEVFESDLHWKCGCIFISYTPNWPNNNFRSV